MNVRFLGTGTSQGVPVIGCKCTVCNSVDHRDQRLRTSVYVEVDGLGIVIDTGPDFRQQMLRERIKKLDAVLFTHEHKDHTAGLDDIRGFNYIQKKPMAVYAEDRVLQRLQVEYSYAFGPERYPGVPDLELHAITPQDFFIQHVRIIPIRVWHHKLPVFGFRIGDFTYITDANQIEPAEEAKIIGSKIIVINGLQHEPHISHFTFAEATALLQKWKPEAGYFTHISHKLGLHRSIQPTLPANLYLAYDGLSIHL